MNYYKITISDRTYVARGLKISYVAEDFYKAYGFEHANDTTNSNEFLAFEPLVDGLKVKGEDAKAALDNHYECYKNEVEQYKESYIEEHGAEEIDYIMNRDFAYDDLEKTTMILQADPEPQIEMYVKDDDTIMIRYGDYEIPLEEYERQSASYNRG